MGIDSDIFYYSATFCGPSVLTACYMACSLVMIPHEMLKKTPHSSSTKIKPAPDLNKTL